MDVTGEGMKPLVIRGPCGASFRALEIKLGLFWQYIYLSDNAFTEID